MAKKSKQAAESDHTQVGTPAPEFDLQDQSGQRHRLRDYRGRWVVLYFYPKDNTSGCTQEACQFRDRAREYETRDAVVLGVSPDGTESHAKFAAKHDLPFTLLADPQKTLCEAYGVWQEKSMYGRKYMGVMRTTVLIDPKGVVAARWDKVKVPDHDAQVLTTLDGLRTSR
jgi:peroxiredoxin Q/BCP